MANEKRVRQNNVLGTLGAGMLLGDNTIAFGTAPGFPTIDATMHAAITLDPDTTAEEIIYLTAYVAGATTGTILRGQEGTTAVAHPINTPWVHGPTARDNAAGRLAFKQRTAGNLSLGSLQYATQILADTPLVWLRLGEAAGATAVDSSGNGRNGTYNGGAGLTYGRPSLLSGETDTAVLFGTAAYVEVPNAAWNQIMSGTIECWINTPAALDGNYHYIMGKPNAVSVYNHVNLVLYDPTLPGDRNTGVNLRDGLPHHLAIVFDYGVANGTLVYLDGVLVFTTTVGRTDLLGNLRIGWESAAVQYSLSVQDEFAYYSQKLTAARILAHYNAARGSTGGGWAPLDTGLDLSLTAFPGDVVEVGMSAFIETGGAGTDAFFDAASMVAGAPVNYWGGSGGAADYGIIGAPVSGGQMLIAPTLRQIVASDIAAGKLNLRFLTRVSASRVLDATAARPLRLWAKNHGPQEA